MKDESIKEPDASKPLCLSKGVSGFYVSWHPQSRKIAVHPTHILLRQR